MVYNLTNWGDLAQRCGGVAEGQTEPLQAAKGRANSEPRSIAAANWGEAELAAGPKK